MNLTGQGTITFDPDFAAPGDWAAVYRTCGLQVVPSYAPTEHKNWKRPALKDWVTLQETLIPDATFARWYGPGGEHSRRANMGLLTGRASGCVFVIDLDEYKTPAALAWWHGVLAEHNNSSEPETWQQVTGGGGRQLFFRASFDWEAPTNRTKIGVDIRGQGGFAVLPPSAHASGTPYSWKAGAAPWECEITDAPGWLMEAVDRLVQEHGGKEDRGTPLLTAPERQAPRLSAHAAVARPQVTAPPVGATPSDFNDFGARIDGREKYMTELIWGAVVHWWRECPLKPSDAESQWHMREAYAVYERKVKSRVVSGEPIAVLLEKEGRGATLFAEKWRRAMSKWDTAVAEHGRNPPLVADEWTTAKAERDAPIADAVATVTGIPLISAFPINERDIPPRDWVVFGLMIKRHVSVLVAPPGSGKSLLTLQWAITVALGLAWGGWTVRKPMRVLVVNAEDDIDEMRRRLFAAARNMGVDQADLAGRVLLAEAPESIIIAKTDAKTKTVVRTPLQAELIKTIKDNDIGCVIVDPFAETFEGDENSNSEIKWAGIIWREVARATGTAVMLVHHTKKYAGGMAGDADASRGGGSLIGTARIICTLFAMTDDEAAIMNIPAEDRTKYVRFDDAKANLSLITGQAKWFEKKGVTLNNGKGMIPGDDVGVLAPWKPPGLMDGVSMQTITQILDAIDRGLTDDDGTNTGQHYTLSAAGQGRERWVGTVITRLLGCDEDRAKSIVKQWTKNEVFETFEYTDPVTRKPRKGVRTILNNRPDKAAS